ncbi:alpha/beta hydrolase [Mycolicibacterium sp. lyk4-40-TYG-92]|uniref:alpha/beta fold hydrolase n=1 Tax=Mycolicibacterium sp. lyk4-40-TYG-92 TaxID=3040295 RepID=UPI00254A2F42|nr:alpha/beta hydrolase [Mycolicibacterium sp. lyk4-40-TYG-92]
MTSTELPDSSYTQTWTGGRGEVRHLVRGDGSRLRYYTTGIGPPLVLIHTVRTQLDYFQRVIPLVRDYFTVYAVDLPGMGWSDIVPRREYEEPEMRSAVVEFVDTLNLRSVTLAGESLGGALALSAAVDLAERVRHVVALNPYDYPSGLERGNLLARVIIAGVRQPVIGPLLAGLEPRPVMRAVLHGGFFDNAALPADLLDELLRSGRRQGYSRVARGVYRSLPGFIAARARYRNVDAPVTLVYSDHDWSRPSERNQVESALRRVHRVNLPRTGHFSALEQPHLVARLILDTLPADHKSVGVHRRNGSDV